MATVINLHNEELVHEIETEARLYDEGQVITRIDRTTRWGNPYRIGIHGNREYVIERYRQLLWEKIQLGDITLEDLAALDNQYLACWCAPKPCHGDILVRAAAWAKSELKFNRRFHKNCMSHPECDCPQCIPTT